MNTALYVTACVAIPAVWGVAMFAAVGWWERRRGARTRRQDDPPPVDYSI